MLSSDRRSEVFGGQIRLGGALVFVRRQITFDVPLRIDGEGAIFVLLPREGFWSRPRTRRLWTARQAVKHA